MAWLERRSGLYRIAFRYGGRKLQHSLKTEDSNEAQTCLARFEENLRLLERGRLELPPGVDLGLFLISDGKVSKKPTFESSLTLGELFKRYEEKLPEGSKEENTRRTERIHIKHLTRIIGARVAARTLTPETLQSYVDKRALEKGRIGAPLSHTTIKKEITTLASIWNRWAVPQGLVTGPAPTRGLIYRKGRTKPPFQTLEQIKAKIARGGLSPAQEKELWESVFLTLAEIEGLLDFVEENARFSFIYPMFLFAAHTGARRSEILRSQLDDFDFSAGTVRIREKKRDRSKEITFRHIPLSARLSRAMTKWFASHAGGQLAISHSPNVPVSVDMATHYFHSTLEQSNWAKLRGWHVFRHSFISNCAARGIDQRIIDAWSGHQTEEMRRRYTHLFPDQHQTALAQLFGETEPLRLVTGSPPKRSRKAPAKAG